ncbi:MAG: putative membrane protein [Reinekea sp.]
MRTRAVVNKDMPLGNLTQMTQAERDQLGQWLLALAR